MLKINKYPHGGFTLIELLVVVLIIGILAAIALPQYQRIVDKTRFSTLMITTKALADANERFYLTNDRYSTNFAELDIDISANSISSGGTYAYFDWGYCVLYDNQEVNCVNNKNLKNIFIIKYDAGTYLPSTINCVSLNEDNSRYDKLCQSVGIFSRYSTCSLGTSCKVYLVN